MHATLDAVDTAAERGDGRTMLNELHSVLHDIERLSIIANLLIQEDAPSLPTAA